MNFNEYQVAAMRTAKRQNEVFDLVHAAIGMQTEIGEFATEVKRAAIYNKEITNEMRAHMIEELGDALWYIALACETLGCSMHEVARGNIAKLKERFPEKYTDDAAEARADKGGLPCSIS